MDRWDSGGRWRWRSTTSQGRVYRKSTASPPRVHRPVSLRSIKSVGPAQRRGPPVPEDPEDLLLSNPPGCKNLVSRYLAPLIRVHAVRTEVRAQRCEQLWPKHAADKPEPRQLHTNKAVPGSKAIREQTVFRRASTSATKPVRLRDPATAAMMQAGIRTVRPESFLSVSLCCDNN